MQRLLVLSPHADDAEIGCGGTIARVVAEGGEVVVALMTAGGVKFLHRDFVSAATRLQEFSESMESLGVQHIEVLTHKELDGKLYTHPQNNFVSQLDSLQEGYKPDAVLIPLPSSHQDHRYAYEVGLATTRPSAAKHRPRIIAAYEYPASGWGDGSGADAGKGGIYVDISKHWGAKLNALLKYETQMRADHHLFSINGVDVLSRMRGLEAGFERAELFHTLRMLY